jgi:ubiquinone/menaquinone biosynthesis C-methylase UbiE
MGDDFAAVYEATAHRITGPVSNTALDIVGVGPGTRIVDIAAGAGALSGPAAERGAAVLATDIAPGMVRRLAERLRPFHRCEAREMDGEALAVPDASFDAVFSIFWRDAVCRLAPRSAGAGPRASFRRQGLHLQPGVSRPAAAHLSR